ncbi:inositol monophosphatase family protein, partial [Citreimonas sp.]|uniref:inositol monophosphatase family protein n=1 Tax=Citreimonas sp. TaxID=3036715 RepID=UPI00405A259A
MTNSQQTLRSELVETAHALADAAGRAILPHFRAAALTVEDKGAGGFDPVTAADRAAERAMRDLLAQRRPDDAILGEEFGAKAGGSGLTWVLDPIDGTRGFMAGTPTWGVLIAVGGGAGPPQRPNSNPPTPRPRWGGVGGGRGGGAPGG